jgi:hypothetical protein
MAVQLWHRKSKMIKSGLSSGCVDCVPSVESSSADLEFDFGLEKREQLPPDAGTVD